jgi:hypothetical protein
MSASRTRWLPWLVALILAAGVGMLAYDAGVAHGLAAHVPPAGAPAYAWHPYGWYHPFGFLFPLFFLFGFFLVVRLLLWGGCRRAWHAGMSGGVPAAFEEWHRRAHERGQTGGGPGAS